MSVDTRKSRFASAVGTELGLIVGFITVVTFFSVGKTWMVNLENLPLLVIMFIWLFGVMVCVLLESCDMPRNWRSASANPTAR